MTAPAFVFFLTCLFLGKIAQMADLSSSVRQHSAFVSANVGDSLTLPCFYKDYISTMFYWYKQSVGQKLTLISTYYKYERSGLFHDEFKNNPRFTLDIKNGTYFLKISDVHISDSATYHCVTSHSASFEFGGGVTVSVKGSGLNIPALFHQSASGSIQPEGSVTLNCTVHTGTCDGEHSVYWFKHSQEAHPGLIYTHGGRNDQCERKDNTQTHTCVYNLPLESLNLTHAGTYYCAVASCGHILFGDGTKLDINGSTDDEDPPALVYFLTGTSAFTTSLCVLMAFLVCMTNKRHSCLCTESQARFSAPSTTNVKVYQHEDHDYENVSRENRVNRRRRQRDKTWSECVYLSVKQ
ncbi:uncharacterized protein LOC115589059 [Sparus aurata]|uniref:Uncharacterized LOC115589059 n=1 Tax=Sparus aurata TaxID=8175 RepID=A0A671XVM9_SPAAU|nr:uncharacterized protein LOC115589059 [Sparus aurata]